MSEFNFALTPQYLAYDKLIYDTYKGCFLENSYIIFGVNLFYFSCDLDKNNKYNANYESKYLQFLKINKTIFRSRRWSFIERYIPIVHHPKAAIKVFLGLENQSQMEWGVNTIEDLFKNGADGLLEGWKNQFGFHDFQDAAQAENYQIVFEKNRKLMQEIISDCLKNKFIPVIVILPLSNYISGQVSDDMFQSFLMDNIQAVKTKETIILNYWKHPLFSNNKYYFNGHCLKEEIADDFTRDVKKQIEKKVEEMKKG